MEIIRKTTWLTLKVQRRAKSVCVWCVAVAGTSILGFAQLMAQRAADEKLKSYAQAVEREAVRIRRIVSDLLGFARQRDNIMPDDADADVVKVVVDEVGSVPLGIRQSMALVAAGPRVK